MNANKSFDRLELILCHAAAGRLAVERLCALARDLGVAAVCVGSAQVERARMLLEESDVKVSALVGFPLGTMESDVKRYEIEAALDCGAQEIDAVLNHGWIKDGEFRLLQREVRDLTEAADERVVKFTLEPGWLAPDELVQAIRTIVAAEARTIALATGLGPRDASWEDLKLAGSVVDGPIHLKATARFADQAAAEELARAGAIRIGVPNWEQLCPEVES